MATKGGGIAKSVTHSPEVHMRIARRTHCAYIFGPSFGYSLRVLRARPWFLCTARIIIILYSALHKGGFFAGTRAPLTHSQIGWRERGEGGRVRLVRWLLSLLLLLLYGQLVRVCVCRCDDGLKLCTCLVFALRVRRPTKNQNISPWVLLCCVRVWVEFFGRHLYTRRAYGPHVGRSCDSNHRGCHNCAFFICCTRYVLGGTGRRV